SGRIPVCTDLLTIGAGTVIRRESIFPCYRAQAGRIETGPVTLGRDVFVSERTALYINTSMGDGAQLGHASGLHSGHVVPGGERWHGSPAQRTDVNYVRVAPAPCGKLRRASYSALTLLAILFLYVPLLEGGLELLLVAVSSLIQVLDPSVHASTGAMTSRGLFIAALIFSLVLFFGVSLVGLLAVGAVPRVLNVFLTPDTVSPLYGVRHGVRRAIAGLGRMKFFTFLFGDSCYIVHYLSWLAYQLSPVVQTGSNFDIEVTASTPLLTSLGPGPMLADRLLMMDDHGSTPPFRLSAVP